MSDLVERKFADLTVRIDRGTCIATENCMEIAPEVLELDDTGICAFKQDPPDVDRERLLEACRVCPVDALIVLDAEGNQIVP